jgi:hypothetical protein
LKEQERSDGRNERVGGPKHNERRDQSFPIVVIVITVMGLLLINGFYFLQGFFARLFGG